MASTITIKWGTKDIITNGIYLGLSVLFTSVLAYLFNGANGLNTNIKFSYSLLTIVGGFASLLSLWNLLKAKNGYSDIVIDHDKVIVKNRSLGYKEDFEFEISDLKSLTIIEKSESWVDNMIDPLLYQMTSKRYGFHLFVALKSKEGVSKLFPQAKLSSEELKSIADQMQQKIKEIKV
ncbi:hypothetical protein [Flammeovirga aprica]|uniref:Uncharacterized protein n=1 Tax=Flammeovirga aprica JL-4 TaxID=694437 RepID=A0A7X9P1K8_9BACT|nr:hypothetical protein [Flammeovirga aprica]NME67558.1 hypothetical protein [Flammeovirga aprica JL-4]